MAKFSFLAAPLVVKMTTFSAASDKKKWSQCHFHFSVKWSFVLCFELYIASHMEAWKKRPTFSKWHSNAFSWTKIILHFDINFNKICSWRSNLQASIRVMGCHCSLEKYGEILQWSFSNVFLEIKSLRLSDADIRHWTRSSLVHVMVCCLFGAKPLPEPMMTYGQLATYEKSSVNFLSKWRPSCLGLNVLDMHTHTKKTSE